MKRKIEVEIDKCEIVVRCPCCLATCDGPVPLEIFINAGVETFCDRCDEWFEVRNDAVINVLVETTMQS